MGILIVWPFYDARFLLPVIPFFAAYTVLAVKALRVPKAVFTVYCVAYAILGFGAMAYSTRITFAGAEFPYRYGDGNLRPTYCAAFGRCREADSQPAKVDPKVLRLLQIYK